MNQTIKYLLPHFYITLALLMSFLAIEKSIAFADQYHTYSALVIWTLFIAYCLLYGISTWNFLITKLNVHNILTKVTFGYWDKLLITK